MPTEKFEIISNHILQKLSTGLSPQLTYHTVFHTQDVLKQSVQIAASEGIAGEEELFLLKVAALYHDTGFLFIYNGHEEKSCEIAEKDLMQFDITPQQIKKIKGLIRATKVPQQPHNTLEQIICDADLDYLGRDDFYPVAKTLFDEVMAYHFVKNEMEWNAIQVRFLEAHHYFTKTSIDLRKEKKLAHLSVIKQQVAKQHH